MSQEQELSKYLSVLLDVVGRRRQRVLREEEIRSQSWILNKVLDDGVAECMDPKHYTKR